MAHRPFLKLGIAELEQKFEQESTNANFCKLLQEELGHRTTPRAKRLKKRLDAVNQAASKPPKEPSLPDKPAPAPQKMPVTTAPASGAQETTGPIKNHSLEEPATPAQNASAGPVSIEPMALDLPPVTDNSHTYSKPEAVLNAWTAMEVLSPATFLKPEALCDGNPKNVISLSNNVLPWQDGIKRYRQRYRLYYQVILGTIPMESAIEALLNVYADSRAQRPAACGEAVLASLMVDSEGRLAGQNPVVISSFGWGLPVALTGDLRRLEQWPLAEQQLLEALKARLAVQDDDGNMLPLTVNDISNAFVWLTRSLGLTDELVKKPSFALCMYQWNLLPDAPDPALLNSFFLKDLAWAKKLTLQNILCPTISNVTSGALLQNRAGICCRIMGR